MRKPLANQKSYRPTDVPTDTASSRVACPRLKRKEEKEIVAKASDGQRYPMPLVSVCKNVMVRGAAAPKGTMTYALLLKVRLQAQDRCFT